MKVRVTIEQDYCPHPERHPCDNVCSTSEFTYEADVPDSLIGPISEPECTDEDFGRKWKDIRPIEKRDMLLEDLWLEAERVLKEKALTQEVRYQMSNNPYWWGQE